MSIVNKTLNIVPIRYLVVIFFLYLYSICSVAPLSAADESGNFQLTAQEKWVLAQVKDGREADLSKFHGQPDPTILRAAFLEDLLLGKFAFCRLPCRGIQISHAVIDGPLNLDYLEQDHPLSLSHCLFKFAVNFQEANFKKDLTLNGSRFVQSANFKSVKTGGNLSMNETVFEQECNWNDAKIGENFYASRARFNDKAAKADFNAVKVGSNAFFTGAVFCGPADFGLLHVGRQFNINKAEFFDTKSTVNFISSRVDEIAYFKEVRFHGPVDFAIAQIGMQFNADAARFFQFANFSGIRVNNTIYFQRAKFHGPVKFEFAEIGINFRGTGAEFIGNNQLNFSKMKVNQKVFLDKIVMSGLVDMSFSNFYDLEIQGIVKDEDGIPEDGINLSGLILNNTMVQREFKLVNAIVGDLDAGNFQVKNSTQIINVSIKNFADLRGGIYQSLDLQQVEWPGVNNETGVRPVYLHDMSYSSISIDKPEKCDYDKCRFDQILNFLETTPFNTQSYVQLESFFKRIGREPWANEVFIRMHDRDLAAKYSRWDPRRWLEWFFWGKLAGYGRAPFRVIFISLLFITIGAVIYDPVYLDPNMHPQKYKPYHSLILRCFLSLDRFLPVDLGLGKQWNSRTGHFLIWFYFYLELILGWILIPIALASIYTQIK